MFTQERQEIHPGVFEDVYVYNPQYDTSAHVLREDIKNLQGRVETMSKRMDLYRNFANYDSYRDKEADFQGVVTGLKKIVDMMQDIRNDYMHMEEVLAGAIHHIDEGWTMEELKTYLIEGRK